MNTNNGKTVFDTDQEIDSVENRFITFPAHLKIPFKTHIQMCQLDV